MPIHPSAALRRHQRSVWVRWGLLMLFLAAALAAQRWLAWQAAGEEQRQRLAEQVRSMEQNLVRQLEGVDAALQGLRAEVAQPARLQIPDPLALALLSDAMPGVRTLLVLDAEGRCVASNRTELQGQDFSGRVYFQRARAAAQPEVLHVSPPFRSVLGVYSLNLSRSLVDAQGRFAGLVAATLDTAYFNSMLRSGLYAADMWAAIAQAEGGLLMYEPQRPVAEGTNLRRAGVLFERHLASGLPTTVFEGPVALTGEQRLLAQHTVQPAGLAMDHGLVLGLSRDSRALAEPWRDATRAYAVSLTLLIAGSGLALALLQRRQAAQLAERLQAEQSLAVTLQSIGDAVIATDPAGRITRLNTAAERLTGWPSAEALGRPLTEVFRAVDGASGAAVPDPVRLVLDRGEAVGLANGVELVARDGRRTPVADSAAPIRTETGEVLGVVMVFSDVTAQYQARRALEDRERQLSAITDALPGPVSRVDREGRYLFANAAYERWFGLTAAEVVGRTQQEVLGPLYPLVQPHVQRAMAGEAVHYEAPTRTRLGTLHALVSLIPDVDETGAVRGHFTIATDITERKRAEKALRAEEQRLRTLLQTLDTGVVVHAADTRIIASNPAASRILGLTEAQLQGLDAVDPAWHFIEEDGTPMRHERFPVAQVLASGKPLHNLFGGVRRPDRAEPLWVLVSAQPHRDDNGRIEQLVVTFVDVTDQVRAQRQLRLLQAAVERLNDIVLITEVDDDPAQAPRIVYANPAFERRSGYREAQVLGRDPSFLLGPDTDRAEADRMARAMRSRQAAQGQLLHYTRHGQPYWVELDVVPLPEPGGRVTHMVAVLRDVTERRAAEAQRDALETQLRAAQKLEAVGTLASGIAHDFNNIVAGILGNVALARQDVGAGHPASTSLQQIERAGLRARNLVRQILTFSRRSPMQRTGVDLREVLDESLALVRTGVPPGVHLEVQRPPAPVWVQGDPTQLQQVLMNLCVNAWQALPESGGTVEVGLAPEGGAARLWVRDTGCGMDEAVRARIFDPFFTTKAPGSGTGLGLAVVHGIVQAHGGHIEVRSALGEGSTFELRLPLGGDASPPSPEVDAPTAGAPGRGQLLWVVDDDDTLREVLPRLLQRAGWRTEAFAGAQQALDRLAAEGERPALLLTDLNMPDISGLELCRRVSQACPDLRLVLASGHVPQALLEQASAAGVHAVLSKEDLLESLVPSIARVLQDSTPAG